MDAGLVLCGPDGGDQGTDAEDGHHTLEIVGQHVQRHLGADLLKGAHLEVGRAHPRLDSAERMLDGIPARTHRLRVLIEPALGRLDNALVFPTRDAALLATGAAIPDRAFVAGTCPIPP